MLLTSLLWFCWARSGDVGGRRSTTQAPLTRVFSSHVHQNLTNKLALGCRFRFKRSFPRVKYPCQECLDAREPRSDELRIVCRPQPMLVVAFPSFKVFIGIIALRLELWAGFVALRVPADGRTAQWVCASEGMLRDLGPREGALGREGPSCAQKTSFPGAQTRLKPQPEKRPWASHGTRAINLAS